MLTLYGDYARRTSQGEIGIGSLIELLSNFGLSQQSIRSAVSRMCRAGLLKARHAKRKSYYSLTKDGFNLLEKGAQRIFHRTKNHWKGTWIIVVYSIPETRRKTRDRLRQELDWMGFGPLSKATWISPNDLTEEVEALATKLKINEYFHIFQSLKPGVNDSQSIVSHCWDLGRIHQKYAGFIAKYRPKIVSYREHLESGNPLEPSECFVEKFKLIHEYRRFPFFDPDLPEELLPKNWLRFQAADLFHDYYNLLTEKANEYFNSVLRGY